MKKYTVSIGEEGASASVDIYVDVEKAREMIPEFSETIRPVETVEELLRELAYLLFNESYTGTRSAPFCEGFGVIHNRDHGDKKMDFEYSDTFEIDSLEELVLDPDYFDVVEGD